MTFPDGAFDVIVSNLCLHNIYDRKMRRQSSAADCARTEAGRRCHPVGLQAHLGICSAASSGGADGRKAVGQPRLHFSAFTHRHCPQASAILAVEEFPHRLPPGLVHFRVQALLGGKVFRLRFATGGATVRETGLIRLQLKLFRADGAGFYRERHSSSIVIDALQLL
jgi:hypothetical protein